MVSLWIGGLIQGTMWNYKRIEVDFDTGQASAVGIPFIQTVIMMVPYYWLRIFGGLMIVAAQWEFLFRLFGSLSKRSPESQCEVTP